MAWPNRVFRSLQAAAAATRELWSLRLEGLHFLTLDVSDPTLTAHAPPSSPLSSWLTSPAKRRLAAHNRIHDFEQLQAQKRTLEAEKDLVDAKIVEYKAAMGLIRRALLCGMEDDEKGEEKGLEVFGIGGGGEMNFARLHMIMLRECRRLKEGLPIYAYHRNI